MEHNSYTYIKGTLLLNLYSNGTQLSHLVKTFSVTIVTTDLTGTVMFILIVEIQII